MDLEVRPPSQVQLPSGYLVKCSNCGFTASVSSEISSSLWQRSVKRKSDEIEGGNKFFIPGLDLILNPKVQIENECAALREGISNQQQKIQDLYTELEEERDASSSAAKEAMSMILRLQREKAEVQMEAKQFKRFAEEKMGHDQQEILTLEDLLYKRDQAIQSLTCEVRVYKHRMLSYGIPEAEVESAKGDWDGWNVNLDSPRFELPGCDYPLLKCSSNEHPRNLEYEEEDLADVEKYAFREGSHSQDHLKNLENRIDQMERSSSSRQLERNFSNTKTVFENVIVGQSPRHSRRFSMDSSSSSMFPSKGPDFDIDSPRKFDGSFKRMDFIPESEDPSNREKADKGSEFGDDMSDRVYTIAYVHKGAAYNNTETTPRKGIPDDMSTPRNPFNRTDDSDPDIRKLYMRLQALEADRESLKQTLISMRTEKAQIVLLKEIAQHLCKVKSPERQPLAKRPTLLATFSFWSIFKWVISVLIFWRRKAHRSKYTFGLSPSNVGLLMLLEKGPRRRQWRCLTRAQSVNQSLN